jgi:hypothetical protein
MRIETTIPLGDWRAVAPAAQRAEALGFDGITMPEISNDPFIPLAFAALATERIQLGTAIAVRFRAARWSWRILRGTCSGNRTVVSSSASDRK